MLNLTSTTLVLTPVDGRDPTTLRRAGPVAADCIHDGLVLHGKRIDPGTGPMDAATPAAVTPAQIEHLNRLVAEHIRKDETATGRDGLVLIDRRLLPHIEPRLRDRVAAPHPDHRRDPSDDTARISMLILPPEPPVPPDGTSRRRGYTLFLDRAGLCTSDPATDEIGHAHTWEQLQWMARGAEPFERGGRLWARDEEHNAVLCMQDIRMDRNPLDHHAGSCRYLPPEQPRDER